MLFAKLLMQHGAQTPVGLRTGQSVAFCYLAEKFALGTLNPEGQKNTESVTTKRTRACQPELEGRGCLPLNAQELGPALQLRGLGRSKGFSSSCEASLIMASLAA